jgi:hypothetical protein
MFHACNLEIFGQPPRNCRGSSHGLHSQAISVLESLYHKLARHVFIRACNPWEAILLTWIIFGFWLTGCDPPSGSYAVAWFAIDWVVCIVPVQYISETPFYMHTHRVHKIVNPMKRTCPSHCLAEASALRTLIILPCMPACCATRKGLLCANDAV